MSNWRRRAAEGIRAGDVFTATRTFDADAVAAFAAQTRDYNPVHFDRAFARLKGFDAPICHGLLTGSLVTLIGGQIGWLATAMEFQFVRPVAVGEPITCTLTVVSVDERRFARAEVRIVNATGAEVVRATLEGFLPSPDERARLAAMAAEGDPTNGLRGPAVHDD